MEPNDTARRIFEAYSTGDLAAIQGLIAPSVVLHMPGRNVLAGDYSGLGAVLALVARAATYIAPDTVRLLDVDVNEGEVATRVEIRGGHRPPPGGSLRLTQRMRIDDEGLVTESWIEPEDVGAWDAFVGTVEEEPPPD